MAEHIDRGRLATDLVYRFEYMSKFLNFTRDDVSILNTLGPSLFPYIPSVVDAIYKKLNSFDMTKKYFIGDTNEFESSSSNEETTLTMTSSQSALLKDALSIYLRRIFLQVDWNEAFLRYLCEIGDLNIDHKNKTEITRNYIHVNALFCYMEHSMIDTIWKIDNLDMKKKRAGVRALNKFFWIQNSLFTMHHDALSKENSVSNILLNKKTTFHMK